MITIISFFPQLISIAENSFEKSGILLGNKINLEVFSIYAVFMTIFWIAEAVYHILFLKIAIKTRALKIMHLITENRGDCSSVNNGFLTLTYLLQIHRLLYLSFIGFKAIFILVLGISIIESLVKLTKWLYRKISEKM